MDEGLRRAIWESLLHADQEQRYWHRMACRYVERDFRSKLFLAIVTSSTVAGWAFWKEHPVVWQSLSGVASLLAIVLSVANWNDKVLAMTELHAKWMQLTHEYEASWRDQSIVDDAIARTSLAASKKIEGELSSKAINLPGQNKKLGEQTYKQVIEERTI